MIENKSLSMLEENENQACDRKQKLNMLEENENQTCDSNQEFKHVVEK